MKITKLINTILFMFNIVSKTQEKQINLSLRDTLNRKTPNLSIFTSKNLVFNQGICFYLQSLFFTSLDCLLYEQNLSFICMVEKRWKRWVCQWKITYGTSLQFAPQLRSHLSWSHALVLQLWASFTTNYVLPCTQFAIANSSFTITMLLLMNVNVNYDDVQNMLHFLSWLQTLSHECRGIPCNHENWVQAWLLHLLLAIVAPLPPIMNTFLAIATWTFQKLF